MGLVRKSKSYEKTPTSKPGRTSSLRTVKRYFSKLAAFFFVTIVFGVIYSGTSQPILNMAWRGEIAWSSAISQSIVKALQYGTMQWPEFLTNGVDAMLQARPFTAAINNFIPLSVLFIGNFYWVSFWLDLLDGREGEVFRYWVIALLTVVWMMFVYALMNGMFFVVGADVTFDADQIEANIQQYGSADPIDKPHAPINGTQVNTSQPGSENTTAVETDDGGFLDTLTAVIP